MSENDKVSDILRERMGSFTEASRPLMIWLRDNGHPHVMAVVCSDRAELLEGLISVPLSSKEDPQVNPSLHQG